MSSPISKKNRRRGNTIKQDIVKAELLQIDTQIALLNSVCNDPLKDSEQDIPSKTELLSQLWTTKEFLTKKLKDLQDNCDRQRKFREKRRQQAESVLSPKFSFEWNNSGCNEIIFGGD